jgi:hypothetical protein
MISIQYITPFTPARYTSTGVARAQREGIECEMQGLTVGVDREGARRCADYRRQTRILPCLERQKKGKEKQEGIRFHI